MRRRRFDSAQDCGDYNEACVWTACSGSGQSAPGGPARPGQLTAQSNERALLDLSRIWRKGRLGGEGPSKGLGHDAMVKPALPRDFLAFGNGSHTARIEIDDALFESRIRPRRVRPIVR